MKATIYIPEALMCTAFIDDAVMAAGGCTITDAQGYWHDTVAGTVIDEDMTLLHMVFDQDKRHAVRDALTTICEHLHHNGESLVLIETHGDRYRAQFIAKGQQVVVW